MSIWHPAMIKAEVEMRGMTLTRLALANGLDASACRVALRRPYLRAEQVISSFIGVPAHELWPERYHGDGTPRHARTVERMSRPKRRRQPPRSRTRKSALKPEAAAA